MDKNLVKAFIFSAAVLLTWQFVASRYIAPPQPEGQAQQQQAPEPAPATPAPAPAAEAAQPPATPVAAPTGAEPERAIVVETSHWTARFTNRGGVPVSWKLTQGPNDKPIDAADGGELELIPQRSDAGGAPLRLDVPGDAAAAERLNTTTWQSPAAERVTIADGETAELVFTTSDPTTNQVVTKKYTFTGGVFDFALAVDSSAGPRPFGVVVGPRIGDQSIKTEGSYSYTPPHAVVATESGNVEYLYGGDVEQQPTLVDGYPRWVGITDNYFAMAVAGANKSRSQAALLNAKLPFTPEEETLHDYMSVVMPVQSGEAVSVFVGPKDPAVLDRAGASAAAVVGAPVDLNDLINYGWFGFMVRPLIPVINGALNFTNTITHNYGWSIIIVTTLFNLLFFPLRYKSSVAMKRAAKLQPRMKELQAKMKKYKPTDPQFKDLQQEQIALMKEGNPLGGCLPMLVQFPFFWAFFIYFTTTFVVRRQPWVGWVDDLTAPDPYYILPVLMCAAQIGSMLVMPMPNADDPVVKMQRRMMTWVMPIVFTYFFLVAAPSGLVLYWMTLNLVGIGIQFAINKMIPSDEEPPADQGVKPDGGKSKSKKRQNRSPELVVSEK
jgi:YidC/Oxa1 family membrane protein insertase